MQSHKGQVTKPSSSDKGKNILVRTAEEEKMILEHRRAMVIENQMKAKAKRALEKLDAKQSHQHFVHNKIPHDRYTGHQPIGSNARKMA